MVFLFRIPSPVKNNSWWIRFMKKNGFNKRSQTTWFIIIVVDVLFVFLYFLAKTSTPIARFAPVRFAFFCEVALLLNLN